MPARRDLYFAGIRRQHPHRNLQSPTGGVDATDRAVSPCWSTDDAKAHAMKRVERVEDLDVRGVDARGIVGAGSVIPISIVSSRAGASPRMAPAGSRVGPASSCWCACSRASFVAYDAGTLHLVGSLEALQDRPTWTRALEEARHTEWVVYAKRPLNGRA
jgi:hypothetical protein